MISDKTKQFIEDYTKRCSNELCSVESKNGKRVISYREWVSQENAVSACEIERKELVKKACEIFKKQIEEANEIVYNMEKYSNYLCRKYFKNVFDVEGSLADFKRELEENL